MPGASGRPSLTTSSSSGEAADDEVAVGRVRRRALAVPRLAVVHEKRGDGAGGAAGAHIEQEVADDEGLLRSDAHGGGRVPHAVRRGLGRDLAVVPGHDDVEVVQCERAEAAQGALDRAQPVAREDADGQPGRAQPADELLRTFIGRGGVRRLEFEALQGEGGRGARLARGQREDPLEYELVRRTADFALDRGEVKSAGMRQRAVEVEEDGPQPERPRSAGAAVLAVTWRRP